MVMTKSLLSAIESLEPRIAPATVIGTVSNGVLKINPLLSTVAANFALVQTDIDSFQLLDGGAPIIFDGVKNIQIKLTDLLDNVDFGFNGSGFRGDVTVNSGLGADTIDFTGIGTNRFDATVVSGGNSLVTFGNAAFLGDMKITSVGGVVANYSPLGSLSETGATTVIQNGTIVGNAKFIAPDTGITVAGTGIYNSDLLVKGGTGLDKVTISGRVDGKVTFAAGEGGSQFVGDQGFFVGGRLSITGGAGNDFVQITMTAADPFTTNLGSAVLTLGGGNNSVAIVGSARLAGSIRVSALDGNDSVNLASSSGILTIGGGVQLSLGGGGNSLTTSNAILNGGLNFLGGIGTDTVTIQSTDVVGAGKFLLGDGSNGLNLFSSNFDSTLYIKGGVANDTIFFGGTTVLNKTTILGGDGANMTTFAGSQLRAGFAYIGGLAGDQVVLNADSQFFGIGSMKGGAGLNVLDAKTLGGFSSFTFTGGVDTDVVLLGSNGGFYTSFKAALGDGNDTANVFTTNFRYLKIDGGVGGDTLTHIADAITVGALFTGFESTTVM